MSADAAADGTDGAETAPVCAGYRPPEEGRGSYCATYGIYLDAAGRFCARCASEPGFREFLERQRYVREGGGCAGPVARPAGAAAGTEPAGVRAWCARFAVAVNEGQCRLCREDPLFRAFLRGQGMARGRTAEEGRACRWRGAVVRTEERSCCGGRTQTVEVRACAQRGEAYDARCTVCTAWEN